MKDKDEANRRQEPEPRSGEQLDRTGTHADEVASTREAEEQTSAYSDDTFDFLSEMEDGQPRGDRKPGENEGTEEAIRRMMLASLFRRK